MAADVCVGEEKAGEGAGGGLRKTAMHCLEVQLTRAGENTFQPTPP